MILHGTTGSGAQFLRSSFADELFQPGQLLDSERHFIILPDGIGHGGSSKPSDGLRLGFPALWLPRHDPRAAAYCLPKAWVSSIFAW